jgi:hypothetical protein
VYSQHDFTTAHGAYLTGVEAAGEVIALRPPRDLAAHMNLANAWTIASLWRFRSGHDPRSLPRCVMLYSSKTI